MRKLSTVCVAYDKENSRILLGMKKRGFGTGKWNGFGGKPNPGESILDTAKREMVEESGVTATHLTEVGNIDFQFYDKLDDILEVHIFRADAWTGEPVEGEEMKPQWFGIDEIPYEKMWVDDKYWLPLLLAGKKFKGKFLFGPNDSILEKDLAPVESL
jgi:8-oxo-dGTP diphosphatase/2-hydroxy-dATP diphosphatase